MAERVGFIFDPTDWEIVTFYLQRMVDGDENLCSRIPPGLIHRLDIYDCEPWNLLPPDEFKHGPSANLAFFFTPRHPAGSSSKSNKPHARRTVRGGGGGGGFWHGKAHEIHIRGKLDKSGGGPIVGRKTSLNFKTRDGIPTGWMMQEYLLAGNNLFQSVALCKIYKKLLRGRRDIDDLQEPTPCYKKQPRVLEIADDADDELPPPCKRQRRNDLQVAGLLPSSSSEDLITTSRGGGQQQYAAGFDSGQGSALTPIAVSEDEEVVAVHSAATSNNFEMFTFAQLLGEEEEEKKEEEMALPAAANEFASFTQLLLEGDKKEEEEVVVPATLDNEEEAFHAPARFLWDEYMLTQYDDFCIDDYLCLENHPN